MAEIRFTKTTLSNLALPAVGKRDSYFDTEVPKLALRVTHAGAKTFYVVRRTGVQVVWLKIGVFPDMTVEQARKAAMNVLSEFAKGGNPAAVKRAVKAEPTFSEAFEQFLNGKRKRDGTPLAEKTKGDYRDLLRLYLESIKSKKLSAIERSEIKTIHSKVTKKSPAQADRVVSMISGVFTYMLDQEKISGANPAARIQKNPSVQRDRFIQADEMPRLFEALGLVLSDAMRDFFLLSLLTGAQRANVSAMQWADIDLGNGVWRLAKSKNGSPQNVTLSPEAITILKARSKAASSSPFVFPGDGKTGHVVEPKKAWATLLKHANIANLRIHDLRRTLGSWQARTGASLTIIGKSLNHKTHQATAIYARLDLDPVRQSVNTATSAMMAAAGMKSGADIVHLSSQKAA